MPKFSLKEKLNIDEIYSRFLGFNSQKRAMAIAGLVVAFLLIIVLPLSCASSKLSKLEKQIRNHEGDVAKIIEKIQEYQVLEKKVNRLNEGIKPEGSVKLTAIMDNLSSKTGVTIDSQSEKTGPADGNFKEQYVDVQVSKVTLSQLVELFYSIENYREVKMKVTTLKITPSWEDRKLLNAKFHIVTMVTAAKES